MQYDYLFHHFVGVKLTITVLGKKTTYKEDTEAQYGVENNDN